MAGYKPNSAAVTVTVRPDGSYYVERERKAPRAAKTKIERVPAQLAQVGRAPSPVSVAVTTSLKEMAGIAVAAKAVAPALGTYGVIAAIGLGVLNAWAESKPAPPAAVPRFQLRRIRRVPR